MPLFEDTPNATAYPVYPTPDAARTSDETLVLTPIPSPEYNDNPDLHLDYADPPDHYRYSEANDRPARRGYIAFFLNPAQHWQSDRFVSGKVETGSQSAVTMAGGMAPDTPQRANIPTPGVTSYGDLVTLTADTLGIEPVSGWAG
jgi:hypothetical protein